MAMAVWPSHSLRETHDTQPPNLPDPFREYEVFAPVPPEQDMPCTDWSRGAGGSRPPEKLKPTKPLCWKLNQAA
jgi:hypothetical protein